MLAVDVYENFLKGRRRSQAVGSPKVFRCRVSLCGGHGFHPIPLQP